MTSVLNNIAEVVNKECNFVCLKVPDYTVPYLEEDDSGELSSIPAKVINLKFTKEYFCFKCGREVLIFEPAIKKAIKRLNRGKSKRERIQENCITYPQAAKIIYLASDKNVQLENSNEYKTI